MEYILQLKQKGVVMGSHEASGLQGLLAGSVAEAVVHKSKRPVLVVKH
jgi:nucleotide-binding universal stress UspA family protein